MTRVSPVTRRPEARFPGGIGEAAVRARRAPDPHSEQAVYGNRPLAHDRRRRDRGRVRHCKWRMFIDW
jgi:hypothetical protein